MQKKPSFGSTEASDIALKLLGYIAGDEALLVRFLDLTGLSPGSLRGAAEDPSFHAALLDHALSDESLLLAFASSAGLKPQSILAARQKLPGFAP